MTAQQIRDAFTKYFVKHEHKSLPSSSLIPDNDPTVLLTTAGMQQFKPYFLGEKDPLDIFGIKRITTIQKSFRTSDIDQVGDTSHLTFFEMLGNFSFGEYWKTEAIDFAWEFLTKTMKLDPDRLWVTIFAGDMPTHLQRDAEAEKAWSKYLPKKRIVALGRDDNFWGPPGQTGSCGPSSEVHWQANPATKGHPGDGTNDFLELWNLVFTEYFQDEAKKLTDLPQKNIDTGMGLERLAMVVQGKDHIFETDLYQPIMDEVMKLPSFGDVGQPEVNARRARVIADHLRAACFLLADGVRFSNKDQGYILRRILRRAADQFLITEFSFDAVVKTVVEHYGHAYPELKQESAAMMALMNAELDAYRKVLNLDVETLVKKMRKQSGMSELPEVAGPSHIMLTPDEAFTLYSTHGVSLDRLERLGFGFERHAVEERITKHQELSRAGAAKKFGGHGLGHGPDTAGMSEDDIWTVTRLHSATHLLQAALRATLGTVIKQSGSDINPERLRFDFTFDRKLTDEEKQKVEDLVNQKVNEDLPVSWAMMPYKHAIDEGALAFFKEKYGEEVKVYSMGDFSKELCGGPHVEHTSQVGQFKITAEQSVGSGLRRIKATVA